MKTRNLGILTQPYLYITINFENLRNIIENFNDYKFGLNMLFPIFAFTKTKNLIDYSYISKYFTNPLFNTSTYLSDIYFDFGIFGVIVINGLLGIIFGYIYLNKLMRKKEIIYIIVYSILCYSLIFVFFVNFFYNPTIWFYLIILFIFNYFIYKNKLSDFFYEKLYVIKENLNILNKYAFKKKKKLNVDKRTKKNHIKSLFIFIFITCIITGGIEVKAVNKPPLIVIDTPVAEETFHRTVEIRGWAISSLGVEEINVLVDGTKVGQAILGGYRPDVDQAFPGYIGGVNSGYRYTLDLNNITKGRHLITLEARGKDGTVFYANRYINVNKLNSLIWIETISNGNVLSNSTLIGGWALNDSGMSNLKILVDNNLVSILKPNIPREDVITAYPQYNLNLNVGFAYFLDTTHYKNGQHRLKIINEWVDGSLSVLELDIVIKNSEVFFKEYNYSLIDMVDKQMKVYPKFYDVSITSGSKWVDATREQVEYYANPNNFLDDYGKYQFLKLNFTYGVTAQDLNDIIDDVPIYKGKDNILLNKGDVFLEAARANDISPIYLVSHALLETGYGTSRLSNGILVTEVDGKQVEPRVVYNVFGINALDSNPDKYGSEYAYKQGWFTLEDAIIGGTKFISSNYINNSNIKQDTLYKMRWNPDKPATHQYATDVVWAYKQISNIKKLFDKCLNAVKIFEIPVFAN